MDYKTKYLKYKQKYLKLLNDKIQYGGAISSIPFTIPKTYSFLFMPLIYYTIDNSSVVLIDGFENMINECISNSKEILQEVPFYNFETFITYFKFTLNTNNIKTLEDIKKISDSDHHIKGTLQEQITNYNRDQSINIIISCMANMLIERHKGKQFVYKS